MERFVNRNQFRALCEYRGETLPYQTLASDIRRGNVIEKDLLIDKDNPINKEYLLLKKDLNRRRASGIEYDLEAEKKQIQLRIAQEDLKIKQLRFQKLQAEVIPSDLVKTIVHAYFKAHLQQTHQLIEQVLVAIGKKFGASIEEISKSKKELINSLNEATSTSRKRAIEEIQNTINDNRRI